jgi:hypothetical protein
VDRAYVIAHCLAKPGAYLANPWGEEDSVAHIGVAPYLHKQRWNKVLIDTTGAPSTNELADLIDDSYGGQRPVTVAITCAHQLSSATSRSGSPPNFTSAKDPSGLTTPLGRGTDTVDTVCL